MILIGVVDRICGRPGIVVGQLAIRREHQIGLQPSWNVRKQLPSS
jgi:hypothetical protein